MPDELELARARARAREREGKGRTPPRGVRSPEEIAAANAADPERQLTTGDELARSFVNLLDAGTWGGAGLATDALQSLFQGEGAFRANRDARQALYNQMPAAERLALGVAGGIANPYSFFGKIKTGSKLLRAGLGALEGGTQGALQGAGENIGTESGFVDPAISGAKWGAGLGGLFGTIASRFAKKPTAGEALVEQTAIADAPVTRQVPVIRDPLAPAPLAIDVAGPVTTAAARKAAQSPKGKAVAEAKLAPRMDEKQGGLLRAFDEVTRTNEDDAVRLAAQIRTAEQARDAANGLQKEQYAEEVRTLQEQYRQLVAKQRDAYAAQKEQARADYVAAKPTEPTPTDALNVLKAEGDVPDVDATLKAMHEARGQVGKSYEDIWQATRGKEVPMTPQAEAFLKTSVGQKVWAKVQSERADLAQFDDAMKLPTRPLRPGSAEFEAVPDAEAWHRMKEYVNKAAKVGAGQGPIEGVSAADAIFARDKMLPALREQSSAAADVDLQYANMSDDMRAFAAGANKGRWSKSFDEMTPSQQELYRQGRRAYFGRVIRSGKSRDALAKQLSDPNTTLAQDADLAFSPGASRRIAQQIATPTRAPFVAPPRPATPARPVPPPAPAEIPQSPEAAGWLTGRGILDIPTIGTGTKPSLGEIQQSLFGMPDTGREALRQGTAAAFRNELAEGRPLNLENPGRQTRFAFAASPDDARRMANIEGAWTRAGETSKGILDAPLATDAPRGSLLSEIAGGMSINPWWWATQTGRRMATDALASRRLARQGDIDKSFLDIVLDEPDAIRRARERVAALEESKRKLGLGVAARAGRAGGRVRGLLEY